MTVHLTFSKIQSKIPLGKLRVSQMGSLRIKLTKYNQRRSQKQNSSSLLIVGLGWTDNKIRRDIKRLLRKML